MYLAVQGYFGSIEGPGQITEKPVPERFIEARKASQAVHTPRSSSDTQIVFGDFHAHTTISGDAFSMSLPILGGEGSHPQADACDYARYCSGLDFWSINDHAEELNQRRWQDTVDVLRQCNAVSPDPNNMDMVSYLGWEWTQMGNSRETHYGHRNVVFAGLDDDEIPTRPIAAAPPDDIPENGMSTLQRAALTLLSRDQRSLELGAFWREVDQIRAQPCPTGVSVRDLPDDCYEQAETPAKLIEKLNDWGHDAILIPHGTTWGNYTPSNSSWRKQLINGNHDPSLQTLVEIYSGHGSADVFRDWRSVDHTAAGMPSCPEPTDDYLPSCWQAGEIMKKRCQAAGIESSDCDARAARTRQAFAERDTAGHLVLGDTEIEDWLDSGQCRDCFTPAFNYRPQGSVQALLALRNTSTSDAPDGFRFGIIGSSDNHKARPGNGFKEVDRRENTEATGFAAGKRISTEKQQPLQPDLVDVRAMPAVQRAEVDRINSFFTTGGLIAAHTSARSREAIWNSVKQKQVYGTSGDRILLWFDLVNGGNKSVLPMGSSSVLHENPTFKVKAVGAEKQLPGCPDYARQNLGEDRLDRLCRNECFNPSPERKPLDRIEVVKITPQISETEPLSELIQDPWLTHGCGGETVCEIDFTDPDFQKDGRESVYYVRAIQEPSNAVNGDNLRCERNELGECISLKPCHGHEDLTEYQDDCLAPIMERAWSSPIFLTLE